MKKNDVIRRNTRLSLAAAGEESVAVSVKGQIQILECDPAVLNRVLDAVGTQATVDEVIQHFAGEFPAEDVMAFLESIREAGLLTSPGDDGRDGHEQEDARADLPPPVLLGEGLLADTMDWVLGADVQRISLESLDKNEKFPEGTVFVACPERADFGQLLELNSLLVGGGYSFILCYFDGEQLAAGPSVLPGLTPCFGCYMEHRRQRLEQTGSGEFPGQALKNLAAAWPLPDTPQWRVSAAWAAELIARETERLRLGGENPELTGNQALFSLPSPKAQSGVEFFPISGCPDCRALALDRLRVGRPEVCPPSMDPYAETPVQYTVGGRRSVSNAETRKMLDSGLAALGSAVGIRRHHDGPLDHLLYRFTAATETRYDPQRRVIVPRQVSRGKGLTEEQAYFSAAFELFERISSHYTGDVDLIRAPYREVRDLAIDMPALIGRVFHRGEMDEFHEDLPVDWVWGHSLVNGEPRLVPASMAFLSNTRFMGQFHDTSSGGLAAGGTLEEAVLQGLLELIEHDAWMIWQANRVKRPLVRLDKNSKNLPAAISGLLDRLDAHGLRLVVRDYTTEFGFPVFRAWMIDDQDFAFYASNGFGASLDPNIALERAISEAYQARIPAPAQRINKYRNPLARDLVFKYHSLFALNHFKTLEMNDDADAGTDFSSFQDLSTPSVSGDIKAIVGGIRKVSPEADVVAVNLTKENIGIPVVRIIAGGGIQKNAEPILSASERLFRLPVLMGHRDEPLGYEDLYNGIYPH